MDSLSKDINIPGNLDYFNTKILSSDDKLPVRIAHNLGEKRIPGRKAISNLLSNLKPVIISPEHGRSFIPSLEAESGFLLMDKYGIPFGAMDIKGLTMGDLEILPDKTTASGLRVIGLQEGDYTSRNIDASDVLRKHGIHTEWIIRASKVQEVEFEEQKMPIKNWLALVWDRFQNQKLDANITEEQMVSLIKTDFHAITRLTQTSRRVRDIGHIKNKSDMVATFGPIFKWLNVLKQQNPNDLLVQTLLKRKLDASNIHEVSWYTSYNLPYVLGVTYSKIANLAVRLKYTHLQNSSLVGSVYDLNSAQGKIINPNDTESTDENLDQDLAMTTRALLSITLSTKIPYPNPNFLLGGYYSNSLRYKKVPLITFVDRIEDQVKKINAEKQNEIPFKIDIDLVAKAASEGVPNLTYLNNTI